MNAIGVIAIPASVRRSEAYEELCDMVARREMTADEFLRRVKEMEHDRRSTDRH